MAVAGRAGRCAREPNVDIVAWNAALPAAWWKNLCAAAACARKRNAAAGVYAINTSLSSCWWARRRGAALSCLKEHDVISCERAYPYIKHHRDGVAYRASRAAGVFIIKAT